MQKNSENYDVIVIGGGPSGMMAAGIAGEKGKRVLLLEKNERLGDKLKATGGGRCNITNAEEDKEALLRHYGKAKDFLQSPFAQFGVADTFKFFESRGLQLVVEARKRAFPATQKAEDVFRVLQNFIKKGGVTIKTGAKVVKLIKDNDQKVVGVILSNKDKYYGSNFIFATGGLSHPELGATGDGFAWLRSLGHTVKESSPDIVPLAVKEKWVKDLSGVSLSFMKITFFLDGVKKFSKKGKILFTHFGLSSPLILNSAREVKYLLQTGGTVTATIDTCPDTDIGSLEKQVIKILDQNKNKVLKNTLPALAPDGLALACHSLLEKGGGPSHLPPLDLDKKVHSLTKEERRVIVDLLKALPLTITGLMGFDRAVVSDGGVELAEIDLRAMRSRLHPNIYVTGDLLNISRPSGGFSLQLCWTTGYVAGRSV